MSGFKSQLLVIAAFTLLMVSPAAAQRDRDAYNPNNQAFEVSGQVSNDSGAPAPNVPVRLEKFSGGLIDQMPTDGRGRFRFPNLARGYYRVIIVAPGMKPAQQEADLKVVAKAYLVFDLVPEPGSAASGLSRGPDVIDARVPAAVRNEFISGRSALARKNYSEAVAHLQKAVAGYPEFFEARLLLATAYIDTREWSKAEATLQSTLEIKPGNATVLISLGEVYWRQKRFKDAEETLLAGLKVDDRAWYGYFTLGRLYWDLNDIPKSGAAVGRTLQLKSDFAEAHLLAGNILLRLNQQERALSSYQEYMKLAPKGEFVPQARDLIAKLQKTLAEKK